MDENAGKIIDIFGTHQNNEANRSLFPENAKEQIVTIALDFVEKQTVKLFLNQVNTPYIAVKVKNHTETMPLISQTFEDWLACIILQPSKGRDKDEIQERGETADIWIELSQGIIC